MWKRKGNKQAQNGEGQFFIKLSKDLITTQVPGIIIIMKANAVGKKYSEVERAYMAGFLDADGAIMATIEKHQEKKFRFRVRITLKITQRDKANLIWFLKKFCVGHIRKNRGTHDWIVRDQKAIELLLNLISPYLTVKRNQVVIAKQILRKRIKSLQDLLNVARLADTLSRFNVRSKNRRKNFTSMIQEHFSPND